MLATVMNAIALQDVLERLGSPTRVLSAIAGTTGRAMEAVLDADIARLEHVAAEREDLFRELKRVDRSSDDREGPLVRDSDCDAEAIRLDLVAAECRLREAMRVWLARTKDSLMEVRKGRRAGRRYSALGAR